MTQEKAAKDNVLQFPEASKEAPEVQEVVQESEKKNPIDLSKFPKIRNRDDARAFEKVLRRSGKTKQEIKNIIGLSKSLTKSFDAEGLAKSKQYLTEGEMVKFNIDRMLSYPDWDKRQSAYKEYVQANINTIFIVKYLDEYQDKPGIVALIDESGAVSPWNFSDADLLVYDKADKTFKEMWLIEESTN